MMIAITLAVVTFERAVEPSLLTLDVQQLDLALRAALKEQARLNGGKTSTDPSYPQILTIDADLWMPNLAVAMACAVGKQYLGGIKKPYQQVAMARMAPDEEIKF